MLVFFRIIILFSALVSLIAGIFFITSPRAILKCSEVFNMIVELDTRTFHYRMGVGICLFITGIFLFFMAYYYHVLG